MTEPRTQPGQAGAGWSIARHGARTLAVVGLLAVASGDPTWPSAWLYGALLFAGQGACLAYLLGKRALLTERTGTHPDVPLWDRLLVPILLAWSPAIPCLLAGLEHRFAASPALPRASLVAGVAFMATGLALFRWAMTSNTFFSSFVRVQRERRHRLVQEGPYGRVRHPGYIGATLVHLGGPLVLQSRVALVAAAIPIVALLCRTALEERLLSEELPGYRAYAERVRYRWVPGVW